MRKLMWMTIGFGVSCGLCAYLPDDTWHLPFAVISCILFIGGFVFNKLVIEKQARIEG